MKKFISVILIAVLLISALPFTAFAEVEEIELYLDTPYQLSLGFETEMFKFSPTEDGWYEFYTKGDADTYCTLYNSDFNEITWGHDSLNDENFDFSTKLYAGYTYYLEVGAFIEDALSTAKFDLIVTETEGVEEVSITTAPDNTNCIIGFENESIILDGLQLTLTLSNGKNILWTYNEDNFYVSGCIVETYIENDGEGHYYLDVICGEGFDRFFFDMIENPIDSISVESMSPIEIYEHSSGMYFNGDYFYNYLMPKDTMMRVYYKDGTTSVVSYYGQVIEGFYFSNDDDQFTAPWGVGEHEFTIDYMGCTTTATVSILPCPYKSVTLISAPTREYIYGDLTTGYIYDGKYTFRPDDLTGLSFEVVYSDGTTEVIDDDDIDMSAMEIDGYMYEIGEYNITEAGNVQVTLSYKGMDIAYSVKVVENPVDSIEVLKAPDKYKYEDIYHADYTGMEIKVNFKDGTNETVVFTDDNIKYELNGSLYCHVPVREYKLSVVREFDLISEEYYTSIVCVGVRCDYKGIEYTETRDIEKISKIENFSYNTDGMIVDVQYTDGTEETLTYSALDYYNYDENMYEGFAMTENGVAYFDTALVTSNKLYTEYRIYTLNNYADVRIEHLKLGDVNFDGGVSILDATAIQRYLASQITLDDDALVAADANADGFVSIMDTTHIQRFIAQIIPEI